jgi:hypothetical protein
MLPAITLVQFTDRLCLPNDKVYVSRSRHMIRVELAERYHCTHIWNLRQNIHPPTSGLPLAARSHGVLS